MDDDDDEDDDTALDERQILVKKKKRKPRCWLGFISQPLDLKVSLCINLSCLDSLLSFFLFPFISFFPS